MKKILLVLFISTLPSTAFGNVFQNVTVGDVTLNYIDYDIGSELYNIKVGISSDAVSLTELSNQYNGVSAMNGIFFCPEDYSECNGLNYTINERFIDGVDLSFYPDTGERGVFGWNENGVPFMHKTGDINPDLRGYIYEGVGNFPILFQDGQNLLENYIDNGLYDSKMQANASRHFICSTQDDQHIFIGRSSATSLEGLTPALYAIGCWDALNLDAGASSHFNYNGREIVKGNREIIDGIIIQRNDINVLEIEKNVAKTMIKVQEYISKYSEKFSQQIIDVLLTYISRYRSDIYDEYSVDNYDEQGNYLGYTLEVTSLSEFKKIYTFNILERELKELRRSID